MTTDKKDKGPKLFDFVCGFQSKMSGQVCTTKVQAVYDAVVGHECVDGKRKALKRVDA